jgi:hypothetical protein
LNPRRWLVKQSRAGMEVVARCRDMALRCARCGSMIVVGLDEHHGLRAIEGALPGHVLCVRNVETPSGSAAPEGVVVGRP